MLFMARTLTSDATAGLNESAHKRVSHRAPSYFRGGPVAGLGLGIAERSCVMPKAGGILRAVAIICVTVMCLMPRAGLAQPADPVALLEQVTKLAREGKFDAAIEVANRLVTVIEK